LMMVGLRSKPSVFALLACLLVLHQPHHCWMLLLRGFLNFFKN
jgi:hypothetical protein